MTETMPETERQHTGWHGWAYGLFWSWNVIFLAFMALGFAPLLLPEVIRGVREGVLPLPFFLYGVILSAVPPATMLLGATQLRRAPDRLLALGYGVEGPLMLVLAVRFFLVRQATAAVTFLLAVTVLGLAAFLWQLLDRAPEKRPLWLAYLRLGGLTLALLVGLYAAVWTAFYVLPLLAQSGNLLSEFVRGLWDTLTHMTEWRWVPFWILGTLLFLYTATLFIGLPVAVPWLYSSGWRHGLRACAAGPGRRWALALTVAVVLICVLGGVLTNQQPQQRAFALLQTPPANLDQARALLAQETTLRTGLLNAYLAPFRYVSAVGEVNHISDLYEWAFKMSPEQAVRVQNAYEAVALPLLYQPVTPSLLSFSVSSENAALRREPVEAARLYESFFDRPIIQGERKTIVRAVRSTWSRDQAAAAWQAVDDREVHLLRQEVTINEHGDWADVELYEVYQNETTTRQEVVYYFSLPESAVLTGLWLGNSPDRAERFTYQVAPRGAAQAVYRNEVRYNRDPALLEQIGPRQYRLRAFPVEPQIWFWDDGVARSGVEAGPPLYLWMTWRVLAHDNAWPLPHLAERRNVYWDAKTVRLVNGQPLIVEGDAWLPATVPVTQPVQPVAHRVDFPDGTTVLVQPATVADLPQPAGDFHLAVVLDRSRSMADRATEVAAALAALNAATGNGTTADVYLTASPYRGEAPTRVKLAALAPDILYYGGQNAAELLAQFSALQRQESYDAIFVLTDGSGFNLGGSEVAVPVPDAPVWMIHLGGDFPLGYDDATLQAVQASGGGVSGSVDEALARLALARSAALDGASTHDLLDDYLWTTLPTQAAETVAGGHVSVHAADDPFAALAARRLILAEMQRQRGSLTDLETLDHLHALAQDYSIVTPYSSMLVLVNKAQEERLEELEGLDDRFQREQEVLGETVNPLAVTGVPEPEEWLLLLAVAALLIWYAATGRRSPHWLRFR